MNAYYHSIETFGTVDGAGIRYVLFLAGCKLGCIFCHNRDSWNYGNQMISISEVLKDFEEYRHFYLASGGGITVSGGEALLQSQFVAELFKACKKADIHTTIDTSGYCLKNDLDAIIPYTDQVLFSLKAAFPTTHQILTLDTNAKIIDNLKYLTSTLPVILRYIVIPGVNNSTNELNELARIITSLPKPLTVELLGYHLLGKDKWSKLNLKYKLDNIPEASSEDINNAKALLNAHGIQVLYQ